MTIPVFFVVCLVLLGMKETAVMLSDPFGGDAVDFDCDQARATRRPPAEARLHPTSDHRHIIPCPHTSLHTPLTPPRPAASATSSWRRSSTTRARSSRAAPTSSRRSSPSPPCSSTRPAATTARDDVLSGRAAVGLATVPAAANNVNTLPQLWVMLWEGYGRCAGSMRARCVAEPATTRLDLLK